MNVSPSDGTGVAANQTPFIVVGEIFLQKFIDPGAGGPYEKGDELPKFEVIYRREECGPRRQNFK